MKIDTFIDQALKVATSKGGFQKKQVNRTMAKNFLAAMNKLTFGAVYSLIRCL